MARVRVPITVVDDNGNAVSGAAVWIQERLSANYVPLYLAEFGNSVTDNPVLSDTHGRVNVWVERGAYKATITGTGITTYEEPFEAAPGSDGSVDETWNNPFLQLQPEYRPLTDGVPSNPEDGDEFVTLVDAGSIMWRFRYRSSTAGSYKWHFVGGSPLTVQNASGTWTSASTTMVVPSKPVLAAVNFPGYYHVSWRMRGSMSVSAHYVYGSVWSMGLNASLTGEEDYWGSSAVGQYGAVHSFNEVVVNTINDVLAVGVRVSSGTFTGDTTRMSVTPIRIG